MKLLDLYCGAGGAAMGYHRAGFDVVGVDIKEQPNYPFEFIQSDVFELEESFINEFDVIHASPPCQAYSFATKGIRNKGKVYPDLLGKTRNLLIETRKPYIIENVVGAKLIKPLRLCGTMFNLRVIRHRLFENGTDVWIYPPCGCQHKGTIKNGDVVAVINGNPIGSYSAGGDNETRRRLRKQYYDRVKARYCTVAGHGGDGSARYSDWCDAMQIDWMNKHPTLTKNKYDLTQAIPPAYTEWIGGFLN
jgi:DNA (cytosine-5)-methyltransferase 1